MKMLLRAISLSALLILAVLAYANWPMTPLPEDARADSIVVYKSNRLLELRLNGEVIKQYSVALGGNPEGHKAQEGDRKTPEGTYTIDYHKADSGYHYALHINYPNESDKAVAQQRGVSPGGLIMIHGIRNGIGFIGRLHRLVDWTNGCIAVTNQEIDEIASLVRAGTEITIKP